MVIDETDSEFNFFRLSARGGSDRELQTELPGNPAIAQGLLAPLTEGESRKQKAETRWQQAKSERLSRTQITNS
jgi:hypothetical protein